MYQNEINALLAAEIRNAGLNDIIKADVVKEKVFQKIKELENGNTESKINENEIEQNAISQDNQINNTYNQEETPQTNTVTSGETLPPLNTQNYKIEPGSQPLDISYEPKTAIVPEIPDFLKDVEPGEIFIYDYNELSVGGENLSLKPFKTLKEPEITKSMTQMWSENGITKSIVYQAKFEKIGCIIFDYKSGMSQFIEETTPEVKETNSIYNENPYMANPSKEIENYIKQNIDIDSKINSVISNIVKNYFLTNSERAINDENTYEQSLYESKETMKEIANNFKKIATPKELIESIEGKNKTAKLVYENKEVKKWMLNGIEYYLPANPMSIRMCYVK